MIGPSPRVSRTDDRPRRPGLGDDAKGRRLFALADRSIVRTPGREVRTGSHVIHSRIVDGASRNVEPFTPKDNLDWIVSELEVVFRA